MAEQTYMFSSIMYTDSSQRASAEAVPVQPAETRASLTVRYSLLRRSG
jgi:hypothetical protein